jgi:hypothetical protein
VVGLPTRFERRVPDDRGVPQEDPMSVDRVARSAFILASLLLSGASASAQEPTTAPTPAPPVAIKRDGLQPNVPMTSERLSPRVMFITEPLAGLHGERTAWCPDVTTSERTLALRWLYGCVDELRIIRPYAVECGLRDPHPDSSALAAAILSDPGLSRVRDRGDLSALRRIAPTLDLGDRNGRVLEIIADRRFRGGADPDECRLLPEPSSTDPVVEIRGDINSLLALVDIDGELVVLRVSGGGYDADSGRDARARGYAAERGVDVARMLFSALTEVSLSGQ